MAYKLNPFTGNFDQVLDKASEIKYSNTTSGLAATNTQAAIDEVQANINALPSPITYKGTWNASTNTPTLANTDTGKTGWLYQVNVAGSVNFGAGSISFEIGDKVVNNGTTWDKWDMTDAVTSVNSQTGAVVLNTDNISEGATNKYFSNALAQAAITGGASSITTANLTASRALESNASGKVAASSVTSTELGYVAGVTSAIQTQLNGKQANLTTAAVSSNITLTNNTVALVDTSVARTLTLPSATANARIVVKDSSGSGDTNAITLNTTGGALIDGSATASINSSYGSVDLISNGTNWFII